MAVRRGRWQAVLLVAVAARIMLDPGVYAYYTAGAVLGTIVVDLVMTGGGSRGPPRSPRILLYLARMTHKLIPFDLHQLGVLRLLFAIGVPALVLGMPGWWIARRRRQARPGRGPGHDHQPGAPGRVHRPPDRSRAEVNVGLHPGQRAGRGGAADLDHGHMAATGAGRQAVSAVMTPVTRVSWAAGTDRVTAEPTRSAAGDWAGISSLTCTLLAVRNVSTGSLRPPARRPGSMRTVRSRPAAGPGRAGRPG